MNKLELAAAFSKLSIRMPRFFQAPGRVNLIGDHTDYNEGFVMPASINRFAYMAMQTNEKDSLIVNAIDLKEGVELPFKDLNRNDDGHWSNYFIGVLSIFKSRGIDVSGVDCVFQSDVPIGAGLSSSAALSCCFAFGLNELFHVGFTKKELVDIAQETEHRFALVNCGNMDQTASLFGKEGQAMLFDCKTRAIVYSPLNIGEYEFLLVDTKVKHSLADSAYNERRAQCELGVKKLKINFPKVSSLRDVTIAMLDQTALPALIDKRCRYVVEENARVQKAALLLKKNDLTGFGALMCLSHEGLSNEYEVSCAELDFIVEKAKTSIGILGVRMMGGGFGGCCIMLIRSVNVAAFKTNMEFNYRAQFNQKPEFYSFSTSNGAS
jgi:galactokinase